MTTRLDTIAIALVQSFALIAAALSGERWAIWPAVASVVALGVVLRLPLRAWTGATQRAESYRTPAHRADDATIEVPSPRPARRRVLYVEYEQANDAAFGLCAGAGGCGGIGATLGALAWYLGASWPLPLCGTFTVAGFVLLGWWARCRSTVQAWRDQERGRGER